MDGRGQSGDKGKALRWSRWRTLSVAGIGCLALGSALIAVPDAFAAGPALTVTKSAFPPDGYGVIAGQVITYTLTVNNPGTATATDTTVTDAVPTGTTYNTGSITGTGAVGGAVTETWTIPSGFTGSTTLTFEVTVNGGAAQGPFTNTANFTNQGTPGCGAAATCNTNTVTHNVGTAVATPCNAIVANGGSGNTTKTLVPGSPTSAGATALYEISYPVNPANPGTFVVEDCPNYGVGGTTYQFTGVPNWKPFFVAFTIPNSPGSQYCNVARTTGPPSAPPGSNRKTVPVCFTIAAVAPPPPPIVSATKSAVPVSGSTVHRGDTIAYTLEVTNTGSSASNAITVTDAIPTGTTYVTSSANLGGVFTALPAPGSLSWSLGALASGQVVDLTFSVTVDSTDTNGQVLSNHGVFTNDNTPGCVGVATCNTNTVTHTVSVSSGGGGGCTVGCSGPTTTTTTTTSLPPTSPTSAPTTVPTTAPPIAATSATVPGATAVHTGEPWAGARPFEAAVLLAGLGLLVFGERERRRGRARYMGAHARRS